MTVTAFAHGLLTGALVYRAIRKHQSRHPHPPAAENRLTGEARETVFQQLAENIQQVFWMADCRERRFVYVSPAMLDLWLVEPQILVNDPSQWYAFIHPADSDRAEKSLSAMLSGALGVCEYRIIRPDGEIRFTRNRAFPVADASGSVYQIAGILEDVTSEHTVRSALQDSRDELVQHVAELKSENRERRSAEEKLRAANDLAEAGNRVKTQFLRNISHELRTPLNGIMGMVQIALDTKLSADQREYLHSAADSASNLLAIVDDILDFSDSDKGRLALSEQPFDLRKCVRDVVKRIAPQIQGKKLEFSYFVSVHAPDMVIGDARRLSQVLIHLLSNAVKFTECGAVGLEVISFADEDSRQRLKFVVSDTGIGVAPENRHAIFEAFTQADGSLTRSYSGVGLGLSICSSLVALMSGDMSMESEPGKGSQFSFTIPVSNHPAGPRCLQRTNPAGRQVLVIDSDPISRNFARQAFAEEQLEATCCIDQDQVLSLLRAEPYRFAAILLASELAGGSGLDLAELLCEKYGLGDRLLMTLSPAHHSNEMARCRKLGVAHCSIRPVDYDVIREQVHLLHSGLTPAAKNPGGPKPFSIGRSLQILLVEDNLVNQIVLRRILEKQGHSVLTADDGLAGLNKLDEVGWNIDLVMMDLQMPVLDGYGATARIRALEQTRGGHLPIIAATAHTMAEDFERCINAGMDGYISKPIQPDVLSKTIASVMAKFPARSAELARKVS